MADGDADRVVAHVRRTLGDPGDWTAPPDHTSVALAAIDAVWGIGVRWPAVRNVLARYRAARVRAGGDPDCDGPEQLLALIDAAGGAEGFAQLAGNRQRTSTRNGVLKAEAVRRAAGVLRDAGISTPAQVRAAALVGEAATACGVDARLLDVAIWEFQSSGRARR